MDEYSYDVAPKVQGALITAHKAVAAFLSFLGTYAGVLIADLSDAAGWVNQVVTVVGGAVGVAWVYWTKNKPKV
jgi:hypothetical protein